MTRYQPQYIQAGSYAASQDRRTFQNLFGGPASVGCAVTPSAAMTLNIAPGQACVPSPNNTGSSLCTSDAVEQVVIGTAPATNSRIDLVVAQARGADLDGGANNDFVFAVVAGTVAASPVAPAVPAGTVALAQVAVGTNVASITAGNITDVRPHGIGLEVPVAAGAPFASYADPMGEVWVSKGGVYGGAWKKARDVLYIHVSRAAAWNIGGTALIPFDTIDSDLYGLFAVGTSLWTLPVAGLWRIGGQVAGTVAAANNWLQAGLRQNALTFTINYATSAGTSQAVTPHIHNVMKAVAGDTAGVTQGGQAASTPGITPGLGIGYSWGYLKYEGTG